jgi:outer membrane lipoprotein-sorting protein
MPCDIIAFWVAFSLVAGQMPAKKAEPEDPALRAARERQAAIKSFDVQFKQTEVITKGAYTRVAHYPRKPTFVQPQQEITLECTSRVVMDGDKIRLQDYDLGRGTLPKVQIKPRRVVSVTKDSGRTMFFPDGVAPEKGPTAWIYKFESRPPDWGDPGPIRWAFRGVDEFREHGPEGELHDTGKDTVIDGRHCREYRWIPRQAPVTRKHQLWLDVDRGYVLRRTRTTSPKGIVTQLDVHYQERPPFGWVPVSWQSEEQMPDGEAVDTTKVEVLSMKLNEPVPSELFDIHLPAGTVVYDPENSRGDHLRRLRVQSDGSMREEAAAIPRSPSETRPEEPANAPVRLGWRDLALVGGSFAIIAAAIVLRHLLLRRRMRADSD